MYNWNGEEFTEHELEAALIEMLDDCYGTIELFGIEYAYSQVVREVDPIMFRTAFLDWMDSEGVEEI